MNNNLRGGKFNHLCMAKMNEFTAWTQEELSCNINWPGGLISILDNLKLKINNKKFDLKVLQKASRKQRDIYYIHIYNSEDICWEKHNRQTDPHLSFYGGREWADG